MAANRPYYHDLHNGQHLIASCPLCGRAQQWRYRPGPTPDRPAWRGITTPSWQGVSCHDTVSEEHFTMQTIVDQSTAGAVRVRNVFRPTGVPVPAEPGVNAVLAAVTGLTCGWCPQPTEDFCTSIEDLHDLVCVDGSRQYPYAFTGWDTEAANETGTRIRIRVHTVRSGYDRPLDRHRLYAVSFTTEIGADDLPLLADIADGLRRIRPSYELPRRLWAHLTRLPDIPETPSDAYQG